MPCDLDWLTSSTATIFGQTNVHTALDLRTDQRAQRFSHHELKARIELDQTRLYRVEAISQL